MTDQVNSNGSKSWQPPHPYSWGLNIPHDITRSALKEQTIINHIQTKTRTTGHTAASLATSDAVANQATLAARVGAAQGVSDNDDKSAGIPMVKQPTPDKLFIQSPVTSAYKAPAAPSTAQPMAEAIPTAPVPRPLCTGILKRQKSEILEIVETIHDNIDLQRADLLVCIPELRAAMCHLMEEHLNDAKMLSTKLGLRLSLIAHFMHHDQLEDKVNGALGHINHMVMDTHVDWTNHVYSFNPPGLWGIDPPRSRGINPSGLGGRVVWE